MEPSDPLFEPSDHFHGLSLVLSISSLATDNLLELFKLLLRLFELRVDGLDLLDFGFQFPLLNPFYFILRSFELSFELLDFTLVAFGHLAFIFRCDFDFGFLELSFDLVQFLFLLFDKLFPLLLGLILDLLNLFGSLLEVSL